MTSARPFRLARQPHHAPALPPHQSPNSPGSPTPHAARQPHTLTATARRTNTPALSASQIPHPLEQKDAKRCFTGQIPPDTGGFFPPTSHPQSQNLQPQSQNLHSLEQSGPKPASHRPDSSTRWKNLPAERSAGVRIPPEDGRILPRKVPLEAKILQSLEQNGHEKQYNHLKTSSHWMNSPTSASSEPLFLHPMEEFSRKPAIHSPNTSTQWRNLDSERHPNT